MEFKLRCERRLGEMLGEMDKHRGGRPKKTGNRGVTSFEPLKYSDIGVDKRLASRAQPIASVPEKKFEAAMAEAKDKERELTRSTVDKLLKTSAREERKRVAANQPASPLQLVPEHTDKACSGSGGYNSLPRFVLARDRAKSFPLP